MVGVAARPNPTSRAPLMAAGALSSPAIRAPIAPVASAPTSANCRVRAEPMIGIVSAAPRIAVTPIPIHVTPISRLGAFIVATWHLHATGTSGNASAQDNLTGQLLVDDVAQTGNAQFELPQNTSEATISVTYIVNLTAASHTIKLQAKNVLRARGACKATNTSIFYMLMAQ